MLAGRRCCRSLLGGGYRDHPNIKESINGAFFFLLLLSCRCVVEKKTGLKCSTRTKLIENGSSTRYGVVARSLLLLTFFQLSPSST